jgi:hypothetical protein
MAAQLARRPAPAPPAWSWLDAARATWGVYDSALGAALPGPSLGRGLRRPVPHFD